MVKLVARTKTEKKERLKLSKKYGMTQKDWDAIDFHFISTGWDMASEAVNKLDRKELKLIYPQLKKSTSWSLRRLNKIVR